MAHATSNDRRVDLKLAGERRDGFGGRRSRDFASFPDSRRNENVGCEGVSLVFNGLELARSLDILVGNDGTAITRQVLPRMDQLVHEREPEVVKAVMPDRQPDDGGAAAAQ